MSKIAVEVDPILTRFPLLFYKFMWDRHEEGDSIFILTGLGYRQAHQEILELERSLGSLPYVDIIATDRYNDEEREMVDDPEISNEEVVNHFKKRMIDEMGFDMVYDSTSDIIPDDNEQVRVVKVVTKDDG